MSVSRTTSGPVVALERLVHPQPLSHLLVVVLAGLIGVVGNEVVVTYRIRVGRRIRSAARVADGFHARTDGLTSLAVVLGAGGAAHGCGWADTVVGRRGPSKSERNGPGDGCARDVGPCPVRSPTRRVSRVTLPQLPPGVR